MATLIPGLKAAERIVESRQQTAKALDGSGSITHHPGYYAALNEILLFIRAELWRQENSEEANEIELLAKLKAKYEK